MNTLLDIRNAAHYWQEVVQPNAIEYGRVRTPRAAFNLAVSLWHIHEWVVVQKNSNADKKLLEERLREYRARVLSKCPELGILHDLATAHKHAVVSRPLGNIATSESEITSVHFSFFGQQPVSEHGSDMRITLDDGSIKTLDEIFGAAFNYWNHILPEHLGENRTESSKLPLA